jgi:acetyl-CoA carboxylase carboxyltransferase component
MHHAEDHVILRKSYGGSYLAMCSQELGADFVYAWPTAEIAVMGAEAARCILIPQGTRPPPRPRRKARRNWRRSTATSSPRPTSAASNFYITDVIEPAETRGRSLALALRKTLNKRELRPAKKHGNIPARGPGSSIRAPAA